MKKTRYTIRLLKTAEDDLVDIITYISAENIAAAQSVLEKIEKNIAHLLKHPYLGRIPDDEELAKLGYRFLVIQNYLIFYTIKGKTILVHRIIHGARNYLNLL